jgi:ATP-dependent DNA helicase DinG
MRSEGTPHIFLRGFKFAVVPAGLTASLIPMIGFIEEGGSRTEAAALRLVPAIKRIFKEQGALQQALQLEHRPQQADMALAIAEAMEGDEALLFEAGTGVGKSLAYLIPGIIRAVDSGKPLVVSSHTIALQEQLNQKDLLLCRALFKAVPALNKYADFKSAVMVGKGNYCCGTRLRNNLKEAENPLQKELFEPEERQQLRALAEWLGQSREGIRQELSPEPSAELWERVNADSSLCSPKNCNPDNCPYQRARSRLQKAQVIIVNHSLLFALLNAGMGPRGKARGILFPEDAVVLDEAHRVPAIATEHFGLSLSSYGIQRALLGLYHPQKKRGFLKRYGSAFDFQCVENALEANREFFASIDELVLRKRSILRIREPEFCADVLSEPLQNLAARLAAQMQREENEHTQTELADYHRRISGYRKGLAQFLSLEEEDHVYWLERGGRGGKIITLRGAPLDVGPYLKQALFERQTAVVLTSATLSDGTSMDLFRRQTGADEARAEIRTSPFDYDNNCRIYLATDAPLPVRGQGRLDLDYLADAIEWSATRCPGGTLVLCTSYADLKALYARLEGPLAAAGRQLLAQGMDFNRSELSRRFREAGTAVLLGTDSFWTGIDVPGPALSQVIVTRLPFEAPGHPVAEARSEAIQQRGGNPFMELSVPDALIKFRQGIGRLIRTANDCGTLMLLDARIAKRPYGGAFMAALPHQNIVRITRQTRDALVDYDF